MTGFRPKHISHASARTGVMAGTTEQMPEPVFASGEGIVRRSWRGGGKAPVGDELFAVEDSNRDFRVADVEHDDH
jgi:hypothetical protein